MTEILRTLGERKIRRLCHFTPSRNFAHILAGQQGILATARLHQAERQVFNQTDLQRLDGYDSHICCSIEYPNPYFFAIARNREVIFRDWVVLMIKPELLCRDGTLFCATNAATGHGAFVKGGSGACQALFARSVTSARGEILRSQSHLAPCPTDLQAEVLIEDQIPRGAIQGVIFADVSQVRRELNRLKLAGLTAEGLELIVCADMFNRELLAQQIRNGIRPREQEWTNEETGNA